MEQVALLSLLELLGSRLSFRPLRGAGAHSLLKTLAKGPGTAADCKLLRAAAVISSAVCAVGGLRWRAVAGRSSFLEEADLIL